MNNPTENRGTLFQAVALTLIFIILKVVLYKDYVFLPLLHAQLVEDKYVMPYFIIIFTVLECIQLYIIAHFIDKVRKQSGPAFIAFSISNIVLIITFIIYNAKREALDDDEPDEFTKE